jgi:hypothetical protein
VRSTSTGCGGRRASTAGRRQRNLVKAYRATAAKLAVAGQVAFVGMQDDVRPFLWAGDIFALPFAYEVVPLAALEAGGRRPHCSRPSWTACGTCWRMGDRLRRGSHRHQHGSRPAAVRQPSGEPAPADGNGGGGGGATVRLDAFVEGRSKLHASLEAKLTA